MERGHEITNFSINKFQTDARLKVKVCKQELYVWMPSSKVFMCQVW